MTDLEIIKDLENEINQYLKDIGKKEKGNIEYTTDENNNVIFLNIENNDLEKIPENVFKMQNLKTLDLGGNNIKKITPLLNIKNLVALYMDEAVVDGYDQFEYLSKAKKLKFHSNWSGNWDIMPKKTLNHNLFLNFSGSGPKDYLETELCFAAPDFFPPYKMVELGYRNPNFYNVSYSDLEKKYFKTYKEINDIKKEDDTKKEKLRNLERQMISELLDIYYHSYNNYKRTNDLPYSIRKLSIKGFYEIEELFIDNISLNSETKELKDPQWIFVTGENGYGKTLFLQSIVIGLFGNKDGNSILAQEGKFLLEFKNNDKYVINGVGGNLDYNQFENFAAYGPARLVKDYNAKNNSRTASLFKPYSELLDIETKLKIWKNEPKFKHLYKSAINILETLLAPQIHKIEVKPIKNDLVVRYIEKNSNSEKTFEELASGYRSIITMVGDIFIRLLENQSTISHFSELAGIVIIDEIDLHLHPKWQKQMVEKLTELFPKIQFIASTHSPIPILGANEDTVIINVNKTENGITAEKLDVDFRTLMPNTLLSSPIFGFDEYLPNALKDLSKLRTEESWDEILFNDEVERRINQMLGGGKND